MCYVVTPKVLARPKAYAHDITPLLDVQLVLELLGGGYGCSSRRPFVDDRTQHPTQHAHLCANKQNTTLI